MSPQGMDSYLATLDDLSRRVGKLSGRFEHAEGWRRRSTSASVQTDSDPLSEALATRIVKGI